MSTENLYNKEAKKKITEMAEDIGFAMMATHLAQKPMNVIPMSTKKVDEEGNIWFLSGKDSDHNKDIRKDDNIQLIYSDPSSKRFLSAFGIAHIVTDKPTLENLYGKVDDTWFDGVDDPNLTAIKFIPTEAYYWEPKSNSIVTLFKMGLGAVTGDKQDVGEKGKLTV